MTTMREHTPGLGALALLAVVLAAAVTLFATTQAHADEGDEMQSIPLLMVVVEFDGGDNPDAAVYYENEYDWSAALFGEGNSPATFFRDMSNGAFTFTPAHELSENGNPHNSCVYDRVDDGVVHVTLHRPHGAWGAVNVDREVTRDFAALVMEALGAAADYVDFSSFDEDGDGTLSQNELAVCICVAGYEASSVTEYTRNDIPLMWSHSGLLSVIDDGARTVGDVRFDSYIAIAERYWTEGEPLETAEQEPLGIVYHELGHAIGLPDLYAVIFVEGPWQDFKVGPVSLMDSGGWQYVDDGGGLRNVPTALDAWSRYALGWTKPTIVTKSGDYTVSSQLSDNGYHALLIPTESDHEYFLVENRQPEGHDASLSDELGVGLLVWHIDNNTYKRYYDANQINDANHHPGILQAVTNGEAIELLLYNDTEDVPDARRPTGITVQPASDPARDMTVHVNLGEQNAAYNALHVLDDIARDQLDMTPDPVLNRVTYVIGSAAG